MPKEPEPIIAEYHLNRHQPNQPQIAVHDLAAYLATHQAHASKGHIHSYYQLIWFQTGTGTHTVDFTDYAVAENTLFFIAKNQVHHFDHDRDYTGVLVHFNEHFLVQQSTEMDFLLKCHLFNDPAQPPFCHVDRGNELLLADYVRLLRQELVSAESFGKEMLLVTYLRAFLIQAQRLKNGAGRQLGQVPFFADEKRLNLTRFVNLVEESYTQGLTVNEYAQRLALSPRTLANLTNELLGKSPSLLIQERIILEAQRLLLHSSLHINQIAFRLGFEDASYFVKYFKKHLRLSPTDFRKATA
jgi:AraC family transcriptional activator of pobA